MSVTAGLVDGDLLVIPTSDGYAQLIEAERLVNPDGATMPKVLPNGNTAVGGFEYDRFDRPVAVHIAEWGVQGQQRKTTTSRVAIGSVLHLAIPVDDTINLTRPEPGLSVLVRHFDQLRNYIGDVATAAQVATLFGLVTKTSQPQQFALELAGSSVQKTNAANSAYTQRETELEPGMMAHLNPGEDIVQIKPEQPTTQFGDYTRSNLSMMGASVGVPLCLWLLDFERVNFASARSALLVAYCGFFVWRNWLTDRLIRPLVR
jgi:capsid protein